MVRVLRKVMVVASGAPMRGHGQAVAHDVDALLDADVSAHPAPAPWLHGAPAAWAWQADRMERHRLLAWLGTSAFLVLAPGVVAGLMPWLLTAWCPAGDAPVPWILLLLGGLLLAAGATLLLDAFVRFAAQGVGTPAPVAPTRHLVVTGSYRYLRNPMYVAVLAIIAGQALILLRWELAVYGAGVSMAFLLFVLGYEEPTLTRRFGQAYQRYKAAVPGWWPRLRPYVETGAPLAAEPPSPDGPQR